jgi:hypothetical protein
MSDTVNQLLDDVVPKRWREQAIREYEREANRLMPGRESANAQDWSFMSPDPSPSYYQNLVDAARERAERLAEERRIMPFPPLAGREPRRRAIGALDYGEGVPDVSAYYQNSLMTDEFGTPMLQRDAADMADWSIGNNRFMRPDAVD